MQASTPSGSPGWMPLLLKNTGRLSRLISKRSNTPSALITPAWMGTPASDVPIWLKRSTRGWRLASSSYQAMQSAQVVVWFWLPFSKGVVSSFDMMM
jgi:hypothetical protein